MHTHIQSAIRDFFLCHSTIKDSTGVQQIILTDVATQQPSLPAPATGISGWIKTDLKQDDLTPHLRVQLFVQTMNCICVNILGCTIN